MNYYNPYYYMMTPNMMTSSMAGMSNAGGMGLFSRLTSGLRGVGWANILSNTQRTLGIVNQALPLVKQASPLLKNAKTMFQIMNEFKKVDTPLPVTPVSEKKEETIAPQNYQTTSTNGPTFFQ